MSLPPLFHDLWSDGQSAICSLPYASPAPQAAVSQASEVGQPENSVRVKSASATGTHPSRAVGVHEVAQGNFVPPSD